MHRAEFAPPSDQAAPGLKELFSASLKVGLLGFGGPAAQIALMHRIFVDEKKWIDEEHYLHALSYCMLLPGHEAQQLATYVGWRLKGALGGVIAGAMFVAPGALVVLALSIFYGFYGSLPLVAAAFLGVKAAVIAFIGEALLKVSKKALKKRIHFWIALAAFAALFLFGVPFPLVVLSAGLAGAMAQPKDHNPADLKKVREGFGRPYAASLRVAALWGAIWLSPLALSFAVLGPEHPLSRVGALFAKLAVVTFGGAYAVLAYLQQQAVNVEGWLSSAQMIDGLGLAETTPGPLVLVNQFVGYLAGWQAEGGGLALALATAAMASWQTFAPSFVWIFVGAPYADALRHSARAAGALSAITAAVLGVIAQLAVIFASHVLFADGDVVTTSWGHSIYAPSVASFNLTAALIAGLSAIMLVRYKANPVLVVIGSLFAGLLFSR